MRVITTTHVNITFPVRDLGHDSKQIEMSMLEDVDASIDQFTNN